MINDTASVQHIGYQPSVNSKLFKFYQFTYNFFYKAAPINTSVCKIFWRCALMSIIIPTAGVVFRIGCFLGDVLIWLVGKRAKVLWINEYGIWYPWQYSVSRETYFENVSDRKSVV